MADPYGYYESNVGGTLNLLRAMRRHDVARLVFSSTAAVFGQPQADRIDEAHPDPSHQSLRRQQADGGTHPRGRSHGLRPAFGSRCATSTPPAPAPTAPSARRTIRKRT
jgi:nucleoside-diphosphate-sugar epimerase